MAAARTGLVMVVRRLAIQPKPDGDAGGLRTSPTTGDGSPVGTEGAHDLVLNGLTGLSAQTRDEILAMAKGGRPDPGEYLSPEYIRGHLEKFTDGVTPIHA